MPLAAMKPALNRIVPRMRFEEICLTLAIRVNCDILNYICSNIVASIHLNCAVDLGILVNVLYNSEWVPKQASRVALRLPTSTANVFKSGKVVCFGAESIDQIQRDLRKYACFVKRSCGNLEVIVFTELEFLHNLENKIKIF